MKNAPIVFIHYGDTPYLKYTLDIAKKTNPDKEVVLLGDAKNKKYEKKLGIRHIPFAKYDEAERVAEFEKKFKYIGGANRQRETDVRFEKFCFKRWFYLHEFMKENGIEKCWYFDSDTLILSPLAPEEEKFKEYEVTEQSNGSNMKGLIKLNELEGFIKTTGELFMNDKYLDSQKEEFKTRPNYAFCDMRAYKMFKTDRKPKTIRLNTIINAETHDENICQPDEMEIEYIPELKRKIKKLYFRDGNIYEKTAGAGKLIKLNSINLSWVTTSFVEKVYYYRIHGKFPPFYVSLLGKISRIPRFIKTKITKEVK